MIHQVIISITMCCDCCHVPISKMKCITGSLFASRFTGRSFHCVFSPSYPILVPETRGDFSSFLFPPSAPQTLPGKRMFLLPFAQISPVSIPRFHKKHIAVLQKICYTELVMQSCQKTLCGCMQNFLEKRSESCDTERREHGACQPCKRICG